MNFKFLALISLIFTVDNLVFNIPSFAKVNDCVSYLTLDVKNVNLTKTREYKKARQEFPNLKPVNEYSSLTGTVVLHASGLATDGYKLYKSYLLNLPSDVKTLLVGTESDYNHFVQFIYSIHVRKDNDGEALDSFLIVENESLSNTDQTLIARWMQDNLGQWVEYAFDEIVVQGLVKSNYRFNFQASQQIAQALGSNVIHTINADHEWGNFTVIGDTGYLIAGSRLHPSLNLNEFSYTGVKNLVILPRPLSGEYPIGIPHSDEFFLALSDKVVATNYLPYADYFRSKDFEVIDLPSFANLGLDFLTYTNAVVINSEIEKIIFVPQFKHLEVGTILGTDTFVTEDLQALFNTNDQIALSQFQEFGSKYNVRIVPVNIPETTIRNYGGPHCLTGLCAKISNPDTVRWARKGTRPL